MIVKFKAGGQSKGRSLWYSWGFIVLLWTYKWFPLRTAIKISSKSKELKQHSISFLSIVHDGKQRQTWYLFKAKCSTLKKCLIFAFAKQIQPQDNDRKDVVHLSLSMFSRTSEGYIPPPPGFAPLFYTIRMRHDTVGVDGFAIDFCTSSTVGLQWLTGIANTLHALEKLCAVD